jgi:hypothetical protein
MDNLDKYIDDLFEQKLSDATLPVSLESHEWLYLRKIIKRKSFFRFSTGTFNVYYLSSILTGVLVGSTLLFSSMVKNSDTMPLQPSSRVEMAEPPTIADTLVNPINARTNIPKEKSRGEIQKFRKEFTVSKTDKGQSVETVMTKQVDLPQSSNVDTPIVNPTTIQTSTQTATSEQVNDSGKNFSFAPVLPDTIVTIDTTVVKKKKTLILRKK